MRRLSAKRRKLIDEASPARQAFAREFPRCWICGKRADDVHEIARGPARGNAYADRSTWLRLCRLCHDDVGDYSKYPIARQLWLKRTNDPEYYDRERVNMLRGRQPDAITESEVDDAVL